MFKGRTKMVTRLTTLILATSVISGCGGGDAATETTIVEVDTRTPTPDWELVWSDEFDGGSLDLDKWTFEINCDGGGNAEEQCYTDSPENLFIEDGILNIVARPTPADANLSKPYTSSRIVTQYQGDWTYGRVEVKAKAPRGQGSWAAAWLMPTNSEYGTWPLSGEIDLVEWVNIGEVRADGDIDRHAHGTLHYGPMQGSNHDFTGTEYELPNASPADDFHVYAVEWEEGEIRWYVDDVLYAYQRDSELTYRASDGAAAGLSEKGWYTQIINDEGDEETVYEKAPYDKDFFIILNNAVGGNWAGRTHQAANYFVGDDNGSIARGVDNSAYINGNAYQVDYVRVYQCAKDPLTGKGCATISSDYYNDTYVTGAAPVPIPPIIPVPVGVDIFTDDQTSWEIFGADDAELIDSGDEDYGEVVEFTVSENSGELGFSGAAYDGTLLPDEALIEFDVNLVSPPADTSAQWLFKVEYELPETSESAGSSQRANQSKSAQNNAANMGYVELSLTDSVEGVAPTQGQWQHYSFEFGTLRALGLDSENIVSIKIYPTVGQGIGAVYQVDNVTIGAAFEGAELLLFEDEENPNWPMWDDQVAKGLSSVVPVVVQDEDPEFGNAAEFYINGNSVVGFTVRQDQGGSGYPFDASSLALTGAIEFDVKLIDPPENPNAPWFLKMESNGGTNLGGTAVDYRLPSAPVLDEWTSYTVSMNALLQQGLDISAIDIALIFPQWGQGDGARFRVDNMIIHSTTIEDTDDGVVKGPDNTVYQELFTLYDDAVRSGWTLWDCCAFLPQVEVMDDDEHNMVVEFTIGEGSDGGTVVGFWGRNSGEVLDLSPITTNGVLRFDLKVVTMPEDETTDWLLKVESSNATGNSFAELSLTDSLQGVAPTLGEWQSYSFPLIELAGAGLNLTEVDLLMMFPQWGKGLGAVYRVDNVFVGIPEGDENPYGDDMGSGGDNGGDNGGDDGGNGDDSSQEPGVELIQNSDFANSAGWGGTDGMVESIVDGMFTANVAVAGNPWDVSLKQNMVLLADSTYTLSFDARSDDARSIIAGLGLDEAPWTNVAETVQLSTEWTTYTFTLTTTGFGSNNSRVFFDLGAEAGQVQLDNVSVVLVTDGNGDDNAGDGASAQLLVNSAFDSSEGWGGTDGMVDSISGGVFTADVAVAGNPWDVSLKQNLTLIADTDYILTFDARSDDARSIIAGLGLDQDPWTNITETVALTSEWTTYTLYLTTTGFGGENNRVFFDLGAEAGQVQLDNVVLMLASDAGSNGDGENSELLVNSAFDSAEGWGGTDGMADSIVDGLFTADVAVAGNPWDVSLKQNLTLVADTDYVLTFDARSDDARSIIAGLGLDEAPWTNVTETVALTTEWATYRLYLTTTGFGGENNRVFFDMGAEAGQVQLDNVSLTLANDDMADDNAGPVVTMAPASIFADTVLDNWASWDCCAGSTPTVVEDDAMYGNVVEFMVNGDTVLGFNGRDNGGAIDASSAATFSFDMKVTSLPTQADAPWLLKIESGSAANFVEVNLSTSQEGVVPTEGQWQTYTFALADLVAAGVNFDTSNIDVVMVFPAWGQGAGAVYRIDNVSFGGETSADDGPVITMAPASLFTDTVLDNWASWDCCAGSTPTIVDDGGDNGSVIEFTVNGDTVLGLNGRDNGGALDASNAATFSFDMKVTSLPTQADAPWLLKIESGNAGSYVEVNLSTSQEGVVPAEGQWQTYTFSMDDLVAAGVNFDRSNIDIVMVFPAWGQGAGAVYRVDNVSFQ